MLFKRKKTADSDEESAAGGGVEVQIDDGTDSVGLPEDIFSLFFVSSVFSVGFLYSMTCFALQIGIHYLITTNLLKDAPEGNPFKVPLKVDNGVVAAQILALVVSFVTAEDVITTLKMIPVGYDDHVQDTFKSASRFKLGLADFMRLFEGVLSILVSFIFIVQSTEVLDLFLNFAAMQFVAMLDNIGFQLAHNGYITDSLETLARKTKSVRFPRRRSISLCSGSKCKVPSYRILRIIFLLSTTVLYAAWAQIRMQQATGVFLNQVCQTFDIRFGDQYYDYFVSQPCNRSLENGCPWKNRTRPMHYAPFSDSYDAMRGANGNLELDKGGRPVYYQRGRQDGFGEGSPPGKFSYCESEGVWVFSVEGVTKPVEDSCNWLMRSPKTDNDAYSLHEAPSSGWSIWTGILEDTSSTFEISCGECESDVDCNYHGACQNKKCECEFPWVGNKCQTCAACTKLSQTAKSDSWGTLDEGVFVQLENVTVYDRPVYYRNQTKLQSDGDAFANALPDGQFSNTTIEVLFYAGTRYYISIWEDFIQDSSRGMQESDLDKLRSIHNDFHATWNLDDNPNRTIVFYTEVTKNPMPIEVQWNVVRDAPLAIFSWEASGMPVRVDNIDFDCAIEEEKTSCSFQSSSKTIL